MIDGKGEKRREEKWKREGMGKEKGGEGDDRKSL